MADPITAGGGTEGLREALCALMWAQQHPHERLIWAEVVKIAAQHPRNMGAMRVGAMRHCADALIAGPLADFLARASAEQARVEAERDEREAWAAAWHRVVETTLILMDLSPALGGDEAASAIQAALAKLSAERDRLKAALEKATSTLLRHQQIQALAGAPLAVMLALDDARAALKLPEAPDAV